MLEIDQPMQSEEERVFEQGRIHHSQEGLLIDLDDEADSPILWDRSRSL